MFVAGAWFFEGLFAGDERPLEIGNWWPVGVAVIGALDVVRAFTSGGSSAPVPPLRKPAMESEGTERH